MVFLIAVLTLTLAKGCSAYSSLQLEFPMAIEYAEELDGGNLIEEFKKNKECTKNCMAAAECETFECKKQCIAECSKGKDLGKEPIEELKKNKECTKNCMASTECDTFGCKKQCIAECYTGKDLDKEPGIKEQIKSRKLDQNKGMKGDKRHGPGRRGKEGYKKDWEKSDEDRSSMKRAKQGKKSSRGKARKYD